METHLDRKQLLELHHTTAGGDPDEYIDIKSIADIRYKCFHCNEITNNLIIHYRKHAYPRICELCGKVCKSKTTWDNHKRDHAGLSTRGKRVTCKICGKKCCVTYIRKHMETHSEERPWVCDVCGSAFKIQEKLNVHKFIHAGIKPYVCMHCGKGFTKNHNLKGHLRTHTGERPFKCNHCGESFTHKVNVKNHVKKAHGIDLWTTPQSEISLHITYESSDTVGSTTSVATLATLGGSATTTRTSESSSSIGVASNVKIEKSSDSMSESGVLDGSKDSITPPSVCQSSTALVTEGTTSTYTTLTESLPSAIEDNTNTHGITNIGDLVPVPQFMMRSSNYCEGGASSSAGPPDEL